MAAYEATLVSGYTGGPFVFKLPQEDWDWANAYHGKGAEEGRKEDAGLVHNGKTDYLGKPHVWNTRYVEFTSWLGRVGEWPHSGTVSPGTRYGQIPDIGTFDDGAPRTVIPNSCQAESDGLGMFAHEFSHIASISDNYANPWSRSASALTEPWDIMSRGTFSGPFGDLARWGVPALEGGSVPSHATQSIKNAWNYFDEGDIYSVNVEDLAKGTPVVVNVVSRNIPLANMKYPADFATTALRGTPIYPSAPLVIPGSAAVKAHLSSPNYHKGLMVNFAASASSEYSDKATRTDGYTNFHLLNVSDSPSVPPAIRMAVEVVDQSGYDSFNHDSGVMLMRVWSAMNSGHSIVDSHLYDIGLTDYFYTAGDKEVPNTYPMAHSTHLADALFKVGKSFTDTGYYKHIRDAQGNIIVPGSEWQWEKRNGRDIVSGDSVNEWVDPDNNLHFYILNKNVNEGRYGDFLSYEVSVRHLQAQFLQCRQRCRCL